MVDPDIGVASAAMREYGKQAGDAAGQVKRIDLSRPAGRVGQALPGGTAGAAASSCGLNAAIPDWGKAIATQGQKVASADATYFETEHGLSGVFGQLIPDGSDGGGH